MIKKISLFLTMFVIVVLFLFLHIIAGFLFFVESLIKKIKSMVNEIRKSAEK